MSPSALDRRPRKLRDLRNNHCTSQEAIECVWILAYIDEAEGEGMHDWWGQFPPSPACRSIHTPVEVMPSLERNMGLGPLFMMDERLLTPPVTGWLFHALTVRTPEVACFVVWRPQLHPVYWPRRRIVIGDVWLEVHCGNKMWWESRFLRFRRGVILTSNPNPTTRIEQTYVQ